MLYLLGIGSNVAMMSCIMTGNKNERETPSKFKTNLFNFKSFEIDSKVLKIGKLHFVLQSLEQRWAQFT